MTDGERVQPVTGTSFTSFADAARKALEEISPGPGGHRAARVLEQEVEDGGTVPQLQYRVTVAQTDPAPDE